MTPEARRQRAIRRVCALQWFILWYLALVGIELRGGFGHKLITAGVIIVIVLVGWKLIRRLL